MFSFSAFAQEGDPFAPDPAIKQVPMDSLINIKILSRDISTLDYYSLYAFEYLQGTEKLSAEFIVPKKDDVYKGKTNVWLKLCRVTQFMNSWEGVEGTPMEVGDYIEIAKYNGKDKQFFNLDPAMPDPVYTVCVPKEIRTDKH